MSQIQLATKIDSQVKKALVAVCEHLGLKINRFIEDAICDKLEELEDLSDLKKLRREPTRPIEVVIKELKKRGKI